MNEIKIGDFVEFYYKNIDGGVIRESPMQIYSITESDSGYVIVVRNIVDPEDRYVLLKTVDNLYIHGPSSNKYIEVKFKKPVNINRIPAEFRDLIGKTYKGPHGNIVMTTDLLNKIGTRYPKLNGNIVMTTDLINEIGTRYPKLTVKSYIKDSYIKNYPEEFFMDLYERRPIPDYEEDEDDYIEDEDYYCLDSYRDTTDIKGYAKLANLFIKYGKVKALKQLHEGIRIPSDIDGEIMEHFNEVSMLNEPMYEYPELIDKNLDRETKKEMIDYLLSTEMYQYPLNFLDPTDSEAIEIFAQKDIDVEDLHEYIHVLVNNLDKDPIDSCYDMPLSEYLPRTENFLENLNNYRNFFFQGFSQGDVDVMVDKLSVKHRKAMETESGYFRSLDEIPRRLYDLRIRVLLERLKNRAMAKSAGKR